MSTKIEALVKPELLVWARESAGLSLEESAKKAQLKTEKLQKCEQGEESLTVNQLRQLAQVYKRPLAVFYLSKPPMKFDALRDFRKLPGEQAANESSALRFEIRRAIYRRNTALELYRDLGTEPPRFKLSVTLSDDFESVALKVRHTLGITLEEQTRFKDDYDALNHWRMAIEGLGAFVFQASSIDLTEMRGFSLSEIVLPVIVVNVKDSPLGRIFTMLHELTHLMLREGGLCNLQERDQTFEKQRIESFCNRVAGAILLPHSFLMRETLVQARNYPSNWQDAEIMFLANRYKISREVVLRRLLINGLTTEAYYSKKRREFQKEYASVQKRGGFTTPDKKVVSSAGPSFVRLVLSSYYQEKITSSNVADYLEVRLKHIPNIEEVVRRRLAS